MKTVADYLKETGGQMNGSKLNGLPTAIELGLTVRDYFAASVLRGLIAAHCRAGETLEGDTAYSSADLASDAYAIADHMLCERVLILHTPEPKDQFEPAEPGNS